MHHYLGFIWDGNDPLASECARRLTARAAGDNSIWRGAFEASGLVVFERTPSSGSLHAQSLPGRIGVVLGRVFPTELATWNKGWKWRVDDAEAKSIIDSKGRTLMKFIWGGYVAFLYDGAARSVHVIRDCSGKVPCYRTHHEGVDIIFSDLADLRELCLPAFNINFEYVTAFALSSQMQIRASGLDEISELLAGDCFKVQRGMRSQYSFWDPSSIFGLPRIDSFSDAVEAVRFTAQRCVDAWASAFERISVSLSGGLDSAIVLGCLRNSKFRGTLNCVNRYGTASVEDERHYARAAASAAGVVLREVSFLHGQVTLDARLYQFPLSTKPTIAWAFRNLDIEYTNEVMRQCGSETLWTGQGGDHLFLQVRSPVGARDYLEMNGLHWGLLQAVRDARHLSRQPFWSTVRTLASRDMARPHNINALIRPESDFLTRDAQTSVTSEYLAHPWMKHAERLAAGRQLQIGALSEVLNRHRPFPGLEAVHEHHPLLSQPLVELCLRIPSYVHLQGGIPRAVERAAFRDLVPHEILTREQKGQSTMSLLDLLHRSATFVRELMMDGVLARERILDRRAIEPFLNHKRPMEVRHIFPLISCIAAELWVQSWSMTASRTR